MILQAPLYQISGKLSYIKAIVRETFRLYPITYSTSRIIAEDVELGGYHIPKGTHCQVRQSYPQGYLLLDAAHQVPKGILLIVIEFVVKEAPLV